MDSQRQTRAGRPMRRTTWIVLAVAFAGGCAGSAPAETSSTRPESAAAATRAAATATNVGPTPNSTPSATGSPRIPILKAGPLTPGTYRVSALPSADIELTIPDAASGWEAGDSTFLGKPPFTDRPGGLMLAFNTPLSVMPKPCEASGGSAPIGPTVDDFVGAMAAVTNAAVEGPSDTEVDGFRGKHVGLTADGDLSGCFLRGLGLYRIPTGNVIRMIGAGDHVDFWVLDVNGTRLVIEASQVADASAQDIALLDDTVRSIEIDAGS